MGWRVELLNYCKQISDEIGFEFFGTWNNQDNELDDDITHVSNGLFLNLDYNNDYISYYSSEKKFTLEKNIDFSLFVFVKNKDFNIEKNIEIFNLCDMLEERMMNQDSPFNTLIFKGEGPLLPHSELIIREQKYSFLIIDEYDKINAPEQSKAGDITVIARDFCIKK